MARARGALARLHQGTIKVVSNSSRPLLGLYWTARSISHSSPHHPLAPLARIALNTLQVSHRRWEQTQDYDATAFFRFQWVVTLTFDRRMAALQAAKLIRQ